MTIENTLQNFSESLKGNPDSASGKKVSAHSTWYPSRLSSRPQRRIIQIPGDLDSPEASDLYSKATLTATTEKEYTPSFSQN